jgi:hypothetical protein
VDKIKNDIFVQLWGTGVTLLFIAMLIVAALGVILAAFEFFSSDQQKTKLDYAMHYLWYWLDEAKKVSLLDWLRRYFKWIVGTAVLIESIYVVWIVRSALALNNGGVTTTLLIGMIIAAIAFWLGLKIIQTILRARSLGTAFLRASLLLCFALTPIFAIFVLALAKSILPSLLTSQPSLSIALLQLLTILVYIISVHCTVIILIFWAAIAIPVAFINVLSALLFVSEPIVRSCAQHPKSIFGGSVLLTAIATLLKVLDRH